MLLLLSGSEQCVMLRWNLRHVKKRICVIHQVPPGHSGLPHRAFLSTALKQAAHPYQLQPAQISVSVCVKQVGQNSNVLVWVSASCCHTAQGHKQDIRYANYDMPGIHIVIKHYCVAMKFCSYKDPPHNAQRESCSDPATIHHTGDMKTLHQ